MGFWDKLRAFLTGDAAPGRSDAAEGLWLYVRCQHCQAPVRVRINPAADLNREDEGPGVYVLRKEMMDDRCFRLMHAEIWYDSAFSIAAADVQGGDLITEAEYDALRSQDRFAT